MDFNGILNRLKAMNKQTLFKLLALFSIGVVMLLIGNYFSGAPPEQDNSPGEQLVRQAANQSKDIRDIGIEMGYERQLEERLAKVFGAISDVGKVEVLLTLAQSSEIVVGADVSSQQSDNSQSTESKIVIINNNDGTDTALVLKEINPMVEGVVVVAEGGDDVFVKDALTKAAQALLNVPAHKVQVFKMRSNSN